MITSRLLISGSILLVIAKIRQPQTDLLRIWKDKKDRTRIIIFGIVGMLAVQYTYFATINYSNAATATVLQFSGPVLIACYLAIRNKRSPGFWETIAILLAVAGTFLLVTHGDASNLTISRLALTMGLLSALALAFYTLYPVNLVKKYQAIPITGWAMVLGGLAFSLVSAPWEVSGVWDAQTYLYYIFVIILGTVYPFYAYITAVQLIGGQKASLLTSLEPLSAALLSVLWLNVSFQPLDWVGSLCIVSTVFILSLSKLKP